MSDPVTSPQSTPQNIFDKMAQGSAPDLPQSGSAPSPATTGNIFDQMAAGTYKAPETVISTTPQGQLINDVGNPVIVPKNLGTADEESFSDTVNRAVERVKSQTPRQNKEEIAKETATIPAKTGQTLAGAATIGLAGPSALAVTGEAGLTGAKILAQLAKDNPTAAKIAKAYAGWMAIHLAHKAGIPLPKILDMIE